MMNRGNKMVPRVIFIEHPRQNINTSSAEKFGEIEYLFDVDSRRCSVFSTEFFQRHIKESLIEINYDPKVDYVCVAGSMVVLAIALVTIAKNYDDFKVLLFSSTENRYIERVFNEG